MPVAGEYQPGNMGQDSKAQRSNPGLISRVRKSIVRSRKGNYSFHECSQTYADIDQAIIAASDDMQLPSDYYRVGHDSTVNGEINGCKDIVQTNGDKMMNRKSIKLEKDLEQNPAKMNGMCSNVTNGFHDDMDALSDADAIGNLERARSIKNTVDNDYMNNEETIHESGADPSTYCIPGEATSAVDVDDPSTYCIPGEAISSVVVDDPSTYCIPGEAISSVDVDEDFDFERQGAKPKQHYNKHKNGLKEVESNVSSATKRQAWRLKQAKAAVQEDYLNVDLTEMRVHEEELDDDIREALKGPVLPPLVLPRDPPPQTSSAPKTPHIEQVFRKDQMDEEELEEMKFASRALGLTMESEVIGNPSTMRPEAPTEGCEMGVDPSEAGLLLMSERDVSLHRDDARGVDEMVVNNTYSETPFKDNEVAKLRPARSGAPPIVDRTSKPVFSSDEEESLFQAFPLSEPPPIPPRIPTRDDDDEEPTHEAITHFKVPLQTRSLSLPRNISPGFLDQQEQDQNSSKVNRRRVISSFFQRRSKRHSTFSERPLPAIPPLQPGKFPVNISRERAATMSTDRRLPQLPFDDSLEYLPPPYDPDEEQPPPPPPKIPIKSQKDLEKDLEIQKIMKARGEFASSLRKISDFGWYWGPMSWDDAETRLENTPDGSFLVRDSSDERHILSLSFRANGTTHHTRIEHQHGKFSFWSQPTSHGSTSVVDFIEEAMKHSHNGSFLYFLRPRMPGLPPAPVQLLYAISRFQKVRSLQHMCRFVVRKNIRLDHIDRLPLPKRLKNYIAGAHYYTPEALEP